jgi:hypothetical protein
LGRILPNGNNTRKDAKLDDIELQTGTIEIEIPGDGFVNWMARLL